MISHHRYIGRAAMLAAAFTLGLTGCLGGASTIKGKVSNGSGTQQQGLGSQQQGLSSNGFGGSSSVSSATTVKVSSIGSGGALSVLAQGKVNADGTYSVDVPSGGKKLVVQSFDASGNVVSSAIIDSTGTGGTVSAPPMDTETSVEAQVLIQMVAGGTSLAEANAIDLRARIDSNVAQAVKANADANGDTQVKIRGLADAVVAAQRTQLKAFAQSGVQTSQSALFDAELTAAQKLDTDLDSGSSASTYTDFETGLRAALQSAGADAKKQAQAESSASVSFRATVNARIQGSGSGSDPVADAAVRQSAALEGHASAAAVDAILKAGTVSSAAQSSAVSAETSLRTKLAASTSASQSASAYADFKTSFNGSASTGVVGVFLGVNASNQLALQTALTATATASAALDSALNSALTATVKTTGSIDFDALANSVVSAYGTFNTAVQAQATALAIFGTSAQPAVDLMVVTQGSFHLGQ